MIMKCLLLPAVNIFLLAVICATLILHLASGLDPPRFQVSAVPNVQHYGRSNEDIFTMVSMGCIATVNNLQFFQSRWFTMKPDGEAELDSNGRTLIRNGGIVVPDHSGTNVVINRLSYLDNGTYRCEIQENSPSNQPISDWASATVDLLLDVRLEPIDGGRPIRTFNDSLHVELSCDMSGYVHPDEDLYWIVDGTPMDSSNSDGSKYTLSYRSGQNVAQFGGNSTIPSKVAVLTVLDVALADTGMYSCAIKNTNLMSELELEVTPASRPSGYPQDVNVVPLSSTSIEISWKEVPKMEQNGNITHYEILYTPVAASEGADLPQQQPAAMATTEGPVSITLLRGLEEYTTYNVSVRAVTIVGSGPLSPPEATQTFEDVPSATPRNLEVISLDKNSFKVSWERPDENEINGLLRLYKVEYCLVKNTATPKSSVCIQVNVTDDVNVILLTSLQEGTTYNVSVAAHTVGFGPADWKLAQTKSSPQSPFQPPAGDGPPVAGIIVGTLLAALAIALIVIIIAGVIVRWRLTRKRHLEMKTTQDGSSTSSVVEVQRTPSPNFVLVSVDDEIGVARKSLDSSSTSVGPGEELTKPDEAENGSLKEKDTSTIDTEQIVPHESEVSGQPKLELPDLLKDEPPQYSLFESTSSPSLEKELPQDPEAIPSLDTAADSAHKDDDIDSALSIDDEHNLDTKNDLLELLQNDQDSD